MLLEFGRAGWIEKVRQQPEKARQVLDKMRTDGVLATLEAVRSKLDQPIPLGYCNVGRVVEAGAGCAGVSPWAIVSCRTAAHAEFVAVGAISARAFPSGERRRSGVHAAGGDCPARAAADGPAIGERFCVIGLGLIGLIAVQLLRANGCRVLGVDPDPGKAALARRFGADVVDLPAGEDLCCKVAEHFPRAREWTAVLITAATDSNEPVQQAARMCRQRGRIVLVGVTGLELDRADFYQKEISFQVSCSYGPGATTKQYESRESIIRSAWCAGPNSEIFRPCCR